MPNKRRQKATSFRCSFAVDVCSEMSRRLSISYNFVPKCQFTRFHTQSRECLLCRIRMGAQSSWLASSNLPKVRFLTSTIPNVSQWRPHITNSRPRIQRIQVSLCVCIKLILNMFSTHNSSVCRHNFTNIF